MKSDKTDARHARRILEFDGLRAIAILLVFAYHFNESVFYFGWVGVDIFFAISGFVITVQCAVLEDRLTARAAIREFYVRRISRILPLYFLMLGALFIAAKVILAIDDESVSRLVTDDILLADSLWKNALFLTNIYIFLDGFSTVPYGITWSLAVEEHFYLLYPFAYFILKRQRFVASLLITIALVFGLRMILVNYLGDPGRMYFFSLTRADALLFGCIAGFAYVRGIVVNSVGPFALVGLISSLVLLAFFEDDSDPMILFGYSLIPMSVAAAMYWLATSKSRIGQFLLANKPMVFIGAISYGMYLIHIWVVNGFEALRISDHLSAVIGREATSVVLFSLELSLTVTVARLSFVYFEAPARFFINRLLRR